MIYRPDYIEKICLLLATNPIVTLIGPRQVGKTTLARQIGEKYPLVTYFDLENPLHYERFTDPLLVLESLCGLVIIDEIQQRPEIFNVLRVLADRPETPCRFLLLGSASPVLLKKSSDSLAGRIAYVDVKGFSLQETGFETLDSLWLRGGFPRSFLATTEESSIQWRQDFIRSFLERDLPALGITLPSMALRRFWMMLAHYHGQLWNSSELARAFGVNTKTIQSYLDILTGTFMIKQLAPWWENISKRQVKSPKIYFNDTGLLHALLNIGNKESLENHPKIGASWEGFIINAVISQLNVLDEEVFFWRTQNGAELDLFIMKDNRRIGFEIKRTTVPTLTLSMKNAMHDLNLSHLYVIHAGHETYPLAKNITATPIHQLKKNWIE